MSKIFDGMTKHSGFDQVRIPYPMVKPWHCTMGSQMHGQACSPVIDHAPRAPSPSNVAFDGWARAVSQVEMSQLSSSLLL